MTKLLGLPGVAVFDGTRVLNEATQCAMVAYQDTSVGNSSTSTLPLQNTTAGMASPEAIYDGLSHYCGDATIGINYDIAGRGVCDET